MKALAFVLLIAGAFPALAEPTPPTQTLRSALQLAMSNENNAALEQLQALLKTKSPEVVRDDVLMALGRVLYQANRLGPARHFYGEVSESSDDWLESLEEQAWIDLRENNETHALAFYQTLQLPIFKAQVSPQAFLIGAYANLRLCNYSKTLEVFRRFKSRFSRRVDALEALAKTGSSPALQRVIAKLRRSQKRVRWASLGPDVEWVPQHISSDLPLLAAVKRNSTSEISQLVKKRAREDLEEIRDVLKDLRMIDIETIHRVSLAQKASGSVVSSEGTKNTSAEVIRFPREEGELWLDEVNHYQVQARQCPSYREQK